VIRANFRQGAKFAGGLYASYEQVVHQPGLDLLVLLDQRFGGFNRGVEAGEDGGDALLLLHALWRENRRCSQIAP